MIDPSTTTPDSGPHAEALLWAEDAADPCRLFFLQACAFLGNCISCADYVVEAEAEEDGQGGGGLQGHGGQHISFEGAWLADF